MILTSGELLDLMESTEPKDWPSPPSRGYGYNGTAGKRVKSWQISVVREFLRRLEGGKQ